MLLQVVTSRVCNLATTSHRLLLSWVLPVMIISSWVGYVFNVTQVPTSLSIKTFLLLQTEGYLLPHPWSIHCLSLSVILQFNFDHITVMVTPVLRIRNYDIKRYIYSFSVIRSNAILELKHLRSRIFITHFSYTIIEHVQLWNKISFSNGLCGQNIHTQHEILGFLSILFVVTASNQVEMLSFFGRLSI